MLDKATDSAAAEITTIFDFAEIATSQIFPDPRKAAEHAAGWVSHFHLHAGGRTLPREGAASARVRYQEGLRGERSLDGLRDPADDGVRWNLTDWFVRVDLATMSASNV